MASNTIKVKAGEQVGNRVALWERDAAHPDGEAFVAGDTVASVARTPAVVARLQDGTLVEVRDEEARAERELTLAELERQLATADADEVLRLEEAERRRRGGPRSGAGPLFEARRAELAQ